MRKVLILAALLMLSSGPSHADHCEDTIDWAGFTVPCHPTDMGALIFNDFLRRQHEELMRFRKMHTMWSATRRMDKWLRSREAAMQRDATFKEFLNQPAEATP